MQQNPKTEWKALYSAFRAAFRDEPPEGHRYVHPDVAAVHAAATAVNNGVRAGFCLRHAGDLSAVWHGANVVPRAMSRGLQSRIWEAELRREGLILPEPEEVLPLAEAAA